MAIPSLVQSKSGNGSTANPTLSFTNPVSSGNLIIAVYIHNDRAFTTVPTDGVNTYKQVEDANDGTGVSWGLSYAFNVAAGTPVITFPMANGGAYAIHEFSGVLGTADPFKQKGAAGTTSSATASPLTLNYSFVEAGDLLFIAAFSLDNIGFSSSVPGSGPSVKPTNVESIASANGSIVTGWGVTPGAISGQITWNFTGATPSIFTAWTTYVHS